MLYASGSKSTSSIKPRSSTGWPVDVVPVPHAAVRFEEPDQPLEGGRESMKLLYSSTEVEVRRYREPHRRTVRHVKIVKVVTPFLFLADFDGNKPHQKHKHWRLAFQEFYTDNELRHYFEVQTAFLMKYRCYAYFDKKTNTWERVRVMKYDTVTNRAAAYFFEHNEFRVVPKEGFMELAPEFTIWPAESFPCHLINIQPPKKSPYWSKESIDYFKKLVEGKSFYSITTSRTEISFPEGFPDVAEYFGVCMIRRGPTGKMTVQAEMVKAGFAEATGVFAGYEEMLTSPAGQICRFDLNHFEKQDSSMVAGPSTTLKAPSAAKVRETLIAMMQDAVNKGHVNNEMGIEIYQEFVPNIFMKHDPSADDRIPACFQQAICKVRLSSVHGPSNLYVQLESTVNELREMETAISLMVTDAPDVQFEEGCAGLPIACLLVINPLREPFYVRAMVRHPIPSVKLLKVVIIDYGYEISIKCSQARHLPEYFRNIPSFAFRIHLDSPMMVPLGGHQWTNEASDTFRKYLGAWNNKVKVYYLYTPGEAETIPLDNYNQDLCWDSTAHKWICPNAPMTPQNRILHTMKSHPMLHKAYMSIGVDILYESHEVNEKCDYLFESLSNTLTDGGFALRLRPLKTMWGQHCSIILAILNEQYMNKQRAIADGDLVEEGSRALHVPSLTQKLEKSTIK